jgi:ferredoxin
MLHIDYAFSSSVTVPFPVASATIGCEGSLIECLGSLFPGKRRYFEKQKPDRLIVSALPHAPFGVSPDILAGFFFDDLGEAFRYALERFDLVEMTVVGLSDFTHVDVKGAVYRNTQPRGRQGIRLDLFEFSRLLTAARDGKVSSGLLLSIFRDPGNVHSFFLPEGISLDRLPESNKDLYSGEMYEPYTGKSYNPGDELSGASEHALVSTDSQYCASPGGVQPFAFPWFDRKIAMRKGVKAESLEQPCINCLACGDHCPADLSPSVLYHQILKGGLHDTPALDLFACTGCGLCSFVCPSGLPLCNEITDAIDKLNRETDE